MKSSKFNISTTVPLASREILFNTMYGSTSIIEAGESEQVRYILNNPGEEFEDPALLELRNMLRRGQYLIEDSVDEIALLKHRKVLGMSDPNRFDLIVMPNMDCNFQCPYCYESHCRKNQMSDEVEARLVKWIARSIRNYKFMLLSWFGGEPTLSPNRVISIGKQVNALASEHGVKLLSHMTTNGYALNNNTIRQYTEIGISSYQITVDGPQEVHDRTRVHNNGKGSFRQIFRNIVLLAEHDEKTKISLRVNYNHNNIDSIPDLLISFPSHIRQQLRIVFEPIFGDASASASATSNMKPSEISAKVNEYYEHARSLGYDISLGSLGVGKLVYCYAERQNQYIVNFNGDVFKCSVTDFDPSKRVGRIDEFGEFAPEPGWNQWFGMEPFEDKCISCSFLPLCMGGCRKDRVENGATGSYCNLVPSNTSQTLKTLAYGTFMEHLRERTEWSASGSVLRSQQEVVGRKSIIASSC